ncbi:hypothetical protein SEUCBS139899_003380 [Sporothrix eucalyptigena]|uniref:Alpha/beta hydrolase fold-3 domain-containing protein n=1 Tax=Sporothrix eucalyptigena TaxID=1812306 RepID=A0ABP0C686_9PEZI
MTSPTPVPFDKELIPILETFGKGGAISRQNLGFLRGIVSGKSTAEAVLVDPAITHEARTITGPEKGQQIEVAILRHKDAPITSSPSAAIYFIHGGGMISGTRFSDMAPVFTWIKTCHVTVVSIEYRLAPEHPYPAGFNDCYAGLQWLFEPATTALLNIDPRRIILAGTSAGGGLTAGVALRWRDDHLGVSDASGPIAMCLIYPMLDHRTSSVSCQQYMHAGLWTGASNIAAWDMYLDGRKEEVPAYASPALAEDVRGLPPTWIDVGSAEPFRDEDMAFAQKLSQQGVPVELHLWPGAWHGFDQLVPTARVSQDCLRTRLQWLQRVLQVAREEA